jgi:hypothetical protein
MANDRVPDPAISINPNLPAYTNMDRLYYEDAIEESLGKAQALTLIFKKIGSDAHLTLVRATSLFNKKTNVK